MQYLKLFVILLVVGLAFIFMKYQCEAHNKHGGTLYQCTGGKYAGIMQDFNTWRKVAQTAAKKQKNNRLEILARLGTDEEVAGVLYILGIELKEVK